MLPDMSLRHGLLGLLAHFPSSGYDLKRWFDGSLAFVWPATQSQLYGELGRLEDAGLIEVTDTGPRRRKVYDITEDGRTELRRWLLDEEPERVKRNDSLLRVFFLGLVTPAEARRYLEREAELSRSHHERLQQVADSTDWDKNDFNRFARLALESGLRSTETNVGWAEWAAEQTRSRRR